jgi:ribosomal protein S18 acetylase RimI-like enzyme
MIRKITSEKDKKQLWDFINKKKSDFFFEIQDFSNNFSETQFWFAKDDNEIIGLMTYNKAQTLRIFGDIKVVENFIKLIEFTPKYISFPKVANDIIRNYVQSEGKRLNMIRLILDKTEISSTNDFEFINLKKDNMNNALAVFQAAEPEDWLSSQADNLPFDKMNLWYGIKKDEQLVSVCWNQIYHHGGHIAFIATHPNHQRKGYATALVSYALIETFKASDFAIIHVREDNIPALHTYRKIGYKDYMEYIVLCNPVMIF